MSSNLLKKLELTKFLFDKESISYVDLVNLLEYKGFNTKFIQKPITDNLEVHSLYIKPELEVAYLALSPTADNYYETADYSCIKYEEIELQFVLDILGFKQPDVNTKKSETIKRSKYVTIETLNSINTFKKKDIFCIYYNKNSNSLNLKLRTTGSPEYTFNMSISQYNDFIAILKS